MSMIDRTWTRVVSGFAFPLHERIKGHDSVRRRRALERSQWWNAEQLDRHRVAGLRTLLLAASTDVPFYRQEFAKRGFKPESVASLEALRALPFLTKAEIRANTESLKSRRARALKRYNTGGSSGEPLVFYIGKDRISHDVAAKWRATRWWGVDIGDPEIVVWGSPIELGAQDRVRLGADALMRTRLLPGFRNVRCKRRRLRCGNSAKCARASCSVTRRRWRTSRVTPPRGVSR